VHALFDTLEALGIPRGVATSTRRSRALPKLEAVGLLARVDQVVAGDEVSRGKPAPDIYLEAAARLGTAPGDCLALEDSNAGVRAGHTAGMHVVMVPDLLAPDDDVLSAGIPVAESLLDIVARFTRQ